jgi:hypothetical protein
MSLSSRNKEIQVQRPAQSLEHFKAKVAGPQDPYTGIMKPLLGGAGIVVLALLAWAGIASIRNRSVERHEAALADLLHEVEGDGTAPAAPDLEKKMREKLPVLEALARSAPAREKAVTEGLLASWKLQLDGKATPVSQKDDPWSRLRQAQAALALGKGDEAQKLLSPLRKDATPEKAWGGLYWNTSLETDRLLGNRDQAWKDLAEYKQRFKDQGDAAPLEQLLKGI